MLVAGQPLFLNDKHRPSECLESRGGRHDDSPGVRAVRIGIRQDQLAEHALPEPPRVRIRIQPLRCKLHEQRGKPARNLGRLVRRVPVDGIPARELLPFSRAAPGGILDLRSRFASPRRRIDRPYSRRAGRARRGRLSQTT